MSQLYGTIKDDWGSAIESAVRELVSIRKVGDSQFVNFPMLYPDGSNVTLRVYKTSKGLSVSDSGFAYREAEAIGAERSFGRLARRFAEEASVTLEGHVISVVAPPVEIGRAMIDVATVSWRTVEEVYARAPEHEEDEVIDELRLRLKRVFGENNLKESRQIIGASTSPWEVSAIVQTRSAPTVFQVVVNHPLSVFRTSTAFRDLADLDNPPNLVAVVQNKAELGSKLTLLSQAGRVIELVQSDEVFVRAAA